MRPRSPQLLALFCAAAIELGCRGTGHAEPALRESAGRITPQAMKSALALGRKLEGKPYDLTFEWSDSRIYCSELVWKI